MEVVIDDRSYEWVSEIWEFKNNNFAKIKLHTVGASVVLTRVVSIFGTVTVLLSTYLNRSDI